MEGPIGSWLAFLCSLLNPLFREHARGHRVVIVSFMGKDTFFFFFGLSRDCMVWGGYLTLAPSVYPQGIQAPSLP